MTATVRPLPHVRWPPEDPTRPKPPRRYPLVLLAVVGVWLVVSVGSLVVAHRAGRLGLREAAAARRALSASGFDEEAAAAHLERARQGFARAHRWSSSPNLLSFGGVGGVALSR